MLPLPPQVENYKREVEVDWPTFINVMFWWVGGTGALVARHGVPLEHGRLGMMGWERRHAHPLPPVSRHARTPRTHIAPCSAVTGTSMVQPSQEPQRLGQRAHTRKRAQALPVCMRLNLAAPLPYALCRNLNYWDSVSTLAGEVRNPGRTFPRALLLAVLLVVAMYLLPTLAALGVMAQPGDWELGYYGKVAELVGTGVAWVKGWRMGLVTFQG